MVHVGASSNSQQCWGFSLCLGEEREEEEKAIQSTKEENSKWDTHQVI